ncbi:MAG: PQQ-binding-like beta-propeller repeat protein [Pirellulaceae bacterium]
MPVAYRLVALVASLIVTPHLLADSWPQFRGPNAAGVSREEQPLPVEIGPEKNVVWKIALAKGHSSPVVAAGRVFVTALDDKQLVTIGLDAKDGRELWRRVAPYDKLESVHSVGSPATSSVATDGDRVYSFFGSSGLYCYSLDGEQIWSRRLGPFNNQFGAMSSPVLAGDKLLMIQDHDTGSHLEARDKLSGEVLWRVERPNMRRNYSTPVIWEVDGRRQVVVSGTAHVMGYDLENGELLWQVAGICRVVSNTPVVGEDGRLYVAATGGGETPPQPSFDELLAGKDANKNGALEAGELPSSPIKGFFVQFDRDANGSLDREEYETIREIFSLSRSVALAIRPGGRGDVTDTHVEWDYDRSICRNSSPLLAGGVLFFVKDGGILTSLDAKTGEVGRQARLSGTGKYFSSPISGDGKVYLLSDRGELSVVSAELDWKQLAEADFGEDAYATPAISDGKIYLRTVESMYCFGIAE